MDADNTESLLTAVLEKRRYSEEMRNALKLVIRDGKTVAEAAATTGVSETKLYVRRKQVIELLEKQCPPGWKQVTVFYPPSAQATIDQLVKTTILVVPTTPDERAVPAPSAQKTKKTPLEKRVRKRVAKG